MSEKKDKQKKEKPVFHKRTDAGKGDKPRVGISYEEWGKKWEAIFRKKKEPVQSYKSGYSGSES